MSRTLRFVALALLLATAAEGQRRWTPELGIQGGFSRLQEAGVGADPVDGFTLPSLSLTTDYPGPAALYAIVPIGAKTALEPSLGASQLSIIGTTVTSAAIGLRLNYALTRTVYGALGGALNYFEVAGTNNAQVGAQIALGYRVRLASQLNARAEATWASFAGTDDFPAFNSYSVLFGVSSPLRSAPRSARARQATRGSWQPVFGVQGGYTNFHIAGQGGFTFLAAPGIGGGLSALALPGLSAQPTLFAIVPLSARLALEPGLDINRLQSSGTTVFAGNLGLRVNYAHGPHWYTAAGGSLQYYKTTGTDAITVPGLNVAGGYRFHLSGAFAGRAEISYTMMAKNDDLGFASQTFGLLFGVAMPLK